MAVPSTTWTELLQPSSVRVVSNRGVTSHPSYSTVANNNFSIVRQLRLDEKV
ncbi:hypothetical protein J6590_055186 [Homalodisca vitripennis]|nr:hypothetical protein J6590_055186 [Homalodisca vitripennis]